MRQVKSAKIALQHNLGLGGAAVVTLYRKANFAPAKGAKAAAAAVGPDVQIVGHAPKAVAAAPAAVAPAPKAKAAAPKAAAPAGGLKAAAVFAQLSSHIAAEPALVKQVGCIYRFDIAGSDGAVKSWLLDLKNGAGACKELSAGETPKADCTVSMKDGDFVQLMSGKLQPQAAFMKGLLKVKGNMMLAQKLSALVKKQAAL